MARVSFTIEIVHVALTSHNVNVNCGEKNPKSNTKPSDSYVMHNSTQIDKPDF